MGGSGAVSWLLHNFWLAIVAVFLLRRTVLFRMQRRARGTRLAIDSSGPESAILSTSALARPWVSPGRWSLRGMAQANLAIGNGTVRLRSTLGRLGGGDICLVARETRIWMTRVPMSFGNREWIAFKTSSGGRKIQIAISSPMPLLDVWNALIEAGCTGPEAMQEGRSRVAPVAPKRTGFSRALSWAQGLCVLAAVLLGFLGATLSIWAIVETAIVALILFSGIAMLQGSVDARREEGPRSQAR